MVRDIDVICTHRDELFERQNVGIHIARPMLGQCIGDARLLRRKEMMLNGKEEGINE